MVLLRLTEQEAAGLRQLIDMANRHEGLKAAQVCLYFDQKIAQACVEASTPAPITPAEDKK